MAFENQTFSMFQGETKNIIATITKEDGSKLDLTGGQVTWSISSSYGAGPKILSKEFPSIIINSNILTIPLYPEDTLNLFGSYYHECEFVDALGNDSILFTGMIIIQRKNK